jgi:hypothetical protein
VSKEQLIAYLKDEKKENRLLSKKIEKLEEKYVKCYRDNKSRVTDYNCVLVLLGKILGKYSIAMPEIELG